jgi:peptidyl-prolyl cis-trans isomerase C
MTDRTAKRAAMPFGRLAAALAVGTALALAPLAALAQDAAQPATDPAAAAPATPAAPAQPDPNAVVANVGNETITEADLGFAAEDLAQELQQVPPDQQRAFLVTVLIDMKVMAQAAKQQGMDQTDIFKRRLAYLEERALRRAYFAEKVAAAVTPDAVKAAYDKFVAGFTPEDEVHAEHILVNSEDDAKAIKAQLDKGANFEELAKEKSTDPSAKQNGGDLGFFSKGQMVKPFEDKAFSMEVGQVSDPVQSQFGWHIIKVVDKRKSSPPSLEQVQQQIGQQLMFKSFDDEIAKLKSGLTIDIPDANLAAAVKAQSEDAAAGAEAPAEAPAQ